MLNYFSIATLLIFGMFTAVVSIGNCASNKVYSIDAEKIILLAEKRGHKMRVKELTLLSECSRNKNVLSVARKANLDSLSKTKPSCLFTLFERESLAKGWKVQAVLAVSNGRGQWKYTINPKGRLSLLTMIESNFNENGSSTSHDIKIKKYILIGPKNSTTWKQAILSAK